VFFFFFAFGFLGVFLNNFFFIKISKFFY